MTRRPGMTRGRRLAVAGVLVGSIVALGLGQAALRASVSSAADAPAFEVDPMWPKPLPNHWILGSTIGVGVDSKDHVFIIHRGFPTLTCLLYTSDAADERSSVD